MSALEKVSSARAALVLDHPFFGALSLRLKMVEDPACRTLWTDGKRLGYNPRYVEEISPSRLQASVAHEVLHCAGGHPWRRGSRNPKLWNMATDYAVNHILKEAGFNVGEDWLMDNAFAGLSAEEIYACLAASEPPSQGGGAAGKEESPDNGDGRRDPSGHGKDGGNAPENHEPDFGPGEVRDAAEETASQSEAEWRVATAAAAKAAKAIGRLPASLNRLVEEAVEPRIDWRQILRRFVQSAAREDYTWRMPNMRYAATGMYLPSLKNETMGPIVVFVDTSGSIGDKELSAFSAEIRSIAEEARPETLWVVYADAAVRRADEFPMGEDVQICPVGGGGTDFRPAFEWVEKNKVKPSCAIYLTDLYGTFPKSPPDYPVLWVATSRNDVPWGEAVRLDL